MKVLDFSWGRPGGAAIKAAGFDGVIRYVAYDGDSGKGLRDEELADLREHGIDIGLVFESTAGRMFDGYPAGFDDAHQCIVSGAAIGFPDGLPFYFACDVDIDPDMLALVDDYLAGAAYVLGLDRIGVYGEYDVIEHCHAVGSATWFWQTYAWSGGKRSDWSHIYQYSNGHVLNGAAVDYNEAVAEWGQWKAREEGEMADPRVDALVYALTGLKGEEAAAALAAWSAEGNSLLAGYTIEQTKLREHLALHAAGRTIQEGWESLYAKMIAEGYRVTRFSGNAVTTGEQSVTLTFTREEQNDQGS